VVYGVPNLLESLVFHWLKAEKLTSFTGPRTTSPIIEAQSFEHAGINVLKPTPWYTWNIFDVCFLHHSHLCKSCDVPQIPISFSSFVPSNILTASPSREGRGETQGHSLPSLLFCSYSKVCTPDNSTSHGNLHTL